MKLIILLLVSILGLDVAYASGTRGQSDFVSKAAQRILSKAAQRIIGSHKTKGGQGSPFKHHFIFYSYIDRQKKNLDIKSDWDRAVENLFATFESDKIAELAQIYGITSKSEKIPQESIKNSLHKFMLNGNTEIADKMVEMGLVLDQDNLQEVLVYALQPKVKLEPLRVDWWEWLLKHGANIDNPQLLAKLFQHAALENDIMLLDWMKDNLFADTEAHRKILAMCLKEALPFALSAGASQTALWLLKQGADTSALEETALLQTAIFSHLVEAGRLSLPLAQYARDIDKNILDEVLREVAYDGASELSRNHIRTMEELLELGAKLTAEELQEVLQKSLRNSMGNTNWLMAHWSIAKGADINALDLNNIVSGAIEDWWKDTNNTPGYVKFGFTDIDTLFDFLRLHNIDHSKLDVEQLLSEATEKNYDAAVAQLNRVDEQVDGPSAAEVLQQLYTELGGLALQTYDARGSRNSWLSDAATDYIIHKESIVWLLLYIGKIRDAHTWQDMMTEVVRTLPYEGTVAFNPWVDALFESMDLTKEKTAEAQSMLNRIFQTQDKHPFPLSFSMWAVDNGADINQPDQHAVMHAIIDNELLGTERGDAPYKDGELRLLPSLNNIDHFLRKSGFYFEGIDQEYILQTTEESDVAAQVFARLKIK